VAGMQLQIGVPNIEETRYDDVFTMSKMGKEVDTCTFGNIE